MIRAGFFALAVWLISTPAYAARIRLETPVVGDQLERPLTEAERQRFGEPLALLTRRILDILAHERRSCVVTGDQVKPDVAHPETFVSAKGLIGDRGTAPATWKIYIYCKGLGFISVGLSAEPAPPPVPAEWLGIKIIERRSDFVRYVEVSGPEHFRFEVMAIESSGAFPASPNAIPALATPQSIVAQWKDHPSRTMVASVLAAARQVFTKAERSPLLPPPVGEKAGVIPTPAERHEAELSVYRFMLADEKGPIRIASWTRAARLPDSLERLGRIAPDFPLSAMVDYERQNPLPFPGGVVVPDRGVYPLNSSKQEQTAPPFVSDLQMPGADVVLLSPDAWQDLGLHKGPLMCGDREGKNALVFSRIGLSNDLLHAVAFLSAWQDRACWPDHSTISFLKRNGASWEPQYTMAANWEPE